MVHRFHGRKVPFSDVWHFLQAAHAVKHRVHVLESGSFPLSDVRQALDLRAVVENVPNIHDILGVPLVHARNSLQMYASRKKVAYIFR